MYTIQNSVLTVGIDAKGAELKSVFHQRNQLEYMWGADPAVWGKTSPVLFPIVGTLKNNTYCFEGKLYQLSRHGFARDQNFSVTEQGKQKIIFTLESNEETQRIYPFSFAFSLVYELNGDSLTVSYIVKNIGEDAMFFSVGGHPAFKLPLVPSTTYEDYQLVFQQTENAGRWPISKDGLIETSPDPLLQNTNVLPLAKELFQRDAIVLKDLQSSSVKLQSDKTPHGLQFDFEGFSYLGLWAAPGADFLCIEPWCGIADSVDTNQEFTNKEGIISLPPDEEFSVSWKVRFW